MRAFSIAAVALIASPLSAVAQWCPGDIDASGAVSIEEVVQVVNRALEGCGDVFYEENFDGTALNAERWVVAQNGAPAEAVAVHDGALVLDLGAAAAAAIPYLDTWVVPFPPSGGFRLDVTLRFPSVRVNGPVFAVLDAAGGSLVRLTAQTSEPSGLTVSIPGGWLEFDDVGMTGEHTFHFTVLDAGLFVAIDDQAASGPFQVDHRPRTIWIGYPDTGQLYGFDHSESQRPPEADECGRLQSPAATNAPWSSVHIERIAVTRTEQRPQ